MRKFNLKVEQKIIGYIETIDFSSGYYKENNNFKCWIVDQKVTWDLLNVDCKCIINMVNVNHKSQFRHQDFFYDQYSINIYSNRTSKNGKAVLKSNTLREYDKALWNIFEFLSYIEVLKKIERKKYEIKNYNIIKILSNSEEACVAAICWSMYKLLLCCPELKNAWSNYIGNMNKTNLETFKNTFSNWMMNTTRHKNDIKQIRNKFINPLFFLYELKKFNPKNNNKEWPQAWDDLSYFRIHPRDKNKPHGLTRKEYQNRSSAKSILTHYKKINISSAKDSIKRWNQQYYKISDKNLYYSEFNDKTISSTIHIHHIWPINEFNEKSPISPNICENLIILTPSEHDGIAHEHGSTKVLNKSNLNLILHKKYNTIINSLNKKIGEYSKIRFYKLLCYIRNTQYISDVEKNPEKLEACIQELITW